MTFDLTFGILQRGLDDFVLLSEDELADGVLVALRLTHNLAEGAGGAAIAAALKWKDQIAGQRVVCVMSGGNLDVARLRIIIVPVGSHCARPRGSAGRNCVRTVLPQCAPAGVIRAMRELMDYRRTLQKTGA